MYILTTLSAAAPRHTLPKFRHLSRVVKMKRIYLGVLLKLLEKDNESSPTNILLNQFESKPEDVHVKKFLNQRSSESSFCKEEISNLTWYLVKTKGR